MHIIKKYFALFISFFISYCTTNAQNDPLNGPAEIFQKPDSIFISYEGQMILSGKIDVSEKNASWSFSNNHGFIDGKCFQTIIIRASEGNVNLNAFVSAHETSFACESEPTDKAMKIVRHVVGQSHSLKNNAIYNRNNDWLISIDNIYAHPIIKPVDNSHYSLSASTWELVIRFRPNYYRLHRSLTYFRPWEYQVWQKPVVGWCSWYAYLDKVTEADIKKTADMLSEKLVPYGLQYLQIDDGYQQTPIGMPDTWLTANKKFPDGMAHVAAYIQSKQLTPAIWTNVSFASDKDAAAHADLFVKDKNEMPAKGNWIGYPMDGSNKAAVEQLIKPVYDELRKQGWQYFKLDALRHLKYEGYNTYANYFKTKNTDRTEAFRNIVSQVRQSIGKENFLLGCWGIRPELTGMIDGCRIGNDGYSFAGLAQFNSYNNVIWRNDPDHIELTPKEAWRSCVATSLTGSLFMLTDKPDVYNNSKLIDAARRSIPVLQTLPGQVYDVDPSRSALIARADIETSGSGPRQFDASSTTTTGLFQLEINMPYESWNVLGRLDERDNTIPFSELGLSDKKEYAVFEFWQKKLKGIFSGSFQPGMIDSNYRCQTFIIREKSGYPQLLATNRHISGGAPEIKSLQWNNKMLSGNSEIIESENYLLYIYEPPQFIFSTVHLKDAKLIENKKIGNMRIIELAPTAKNISWDIVYK
ncbi:MAG TPA: alpha-galactosidase [Puia sp.]|nr:alpha-galactosidase [Puia sp.]